MTNLGNMYRQGLGVPQDDIAAVTWYRSAAAGRSAAGMYSLAWMLSHGRGVQRDDRAAARWLRASASAGQAQAMYSLAVVLASGLGVSRDASEAATWLLRSERAGNRHFRETVSTLPLETRIEVQRQLRDAGHYTGALDGSFGPASLAALRAYAGG